MSVLLGCQEGLFWFFRARVIGQRLFIRAMRGGASSGSVHVTRQGPIVCGVVNDVHHINGTIYNALSRGVLVRFRNVGRTHRWHGATFHYIGNVGKGFLIFLRIFVMDGQGPLRHNRGQRRHTVRAPNLTSSGFYGVQVFLL